MSKVLDDAVTSDDDGQTWDFRCPGVEGDPCGPWTSVGWPTKKTAAARGAQHFATHRGEPMPELADFWAEHGLAPHADGIHAVRIEDLP